MTPPDAPALPAPAPTATPTLSVVVPALNEAAALPALLADLARLAELGVAAEVIVADGGSDDGTRAAAARAGARVVDAPRGRGRQLAAGAAAARGGWLCFLHADARLDAAAAAELAAAVRAAPAARGAWAFRLAIDAPGLAFRVVERGANLRSRALGLPYGDQGLLLSRAAYDAAGGYPAVPLMEDVMLVRALARRGRVRLFRGAVRVSPRRWSRDGVWRRSARNLLILARFLAGAAPEALAADYERASRRARRAR